MADEKPTKKDINKVLEKVEKGAGRKESEQRIVDRAVSKEKKPPEKPKDKLDIILEEIQGVKKDLKQYQGKTDKLEQVYNSSVTRRQTKKQGSETTAKTNQQLLEEAEREQEQGERTEQAKGQITQEEYQALSAEEKVKFWEQQARRTSQGPTAEQALAEGKRRQEPQPKASKTGINPQYIYLLTKTIENLGPIVQTAIAKAGGEKKSGESLESLGKDLVTGFLKKAIEGQTTGAGSDGTQQLQVFSNIQNQVLGNFFSTLKLLGKEPAQKMVANIFANPSLPGFQTLPGSSEQRINP